MLRRVDRSFAFEVPDATTADLRAGAESGGLPYGYHVRVRGDRISVVFQTTSQFSTRVSWSGTMSDHAAGVRLEGRIHNWAARIINGCFAFAALIAVAICVVAAVDGGGLTATLGTAVCAVVLLGLWRWYAPHVAREVEEHREQTRTVIEGMLDRSPTA